MNFVINDSFSVLQMLLNFAIAKRFSSDIRVHSLMVDKERLCSTPPTVSYVCI